MAEEKQVKQEESKPQKKIVQITTSTTNTGQIVVTGLCNDGTVWYKVLTGNDEWKKVNPL
jgi:hypothetical protein